MPKFGQSRNVFILSIVAIRDINFKNDLVSLPKTNWIDGPSFFLFLPHEYYASSKIKKLSPRKKWLPKNAERLMALIIAQDKWFSRPRGSQPKSAERQMHKCEQNVVHRLLQNAFFTPPVLCAWSGVTLLCREYPHRADKSAHITVNYRSVNQQNVNANTRTKKESTIMKQLRHNQDEWWWLLICVLTSNQSNRLE